MGLGWGWEADYLCESNTRICLGHARSVCYARGLVEVGTASIVIQGISEFIHHVSPFFSLPLFFPLSLSLFLSLCDRGLTHTPFDTTSDEACQNLSSLKFSQSNRSPDPQDPTRIITTTTTTTFSMTREMAKGICQHFLDSHLIINAAEPKQLQFKNNGIFMITPKGLHVLERFITKNGISAEHLLKVFASQAICLKLLHLERRSSDDEILIGRGVVEIVFKRFAGRGPNLVNNAGSGSGAGEKGDRRREEKEEGSFSIGKREEEGDEPDRNLGVPIKRLSPSSFTSSSNTSHSSSSSCLEFHFLAPSAIEWLCDYTTIVAKDEAADMCAHFVRYGLIGIVEDGKKSTTTMGMPTGRGYDPAKIAWVRTIGAAGSTVSTGWLGEGGSGGGMRMLMLKTRTPADRVKRNSDSGRRLGTV
jgi:hypothetical protein